MFLAVPSFLIIGQLEKWLLLGYTPSIGWQILAYSILTASEVLVSITCLEFSYTQAPNSLKSIIMGFFLLSVSLGNLITAGINTFLSTSNLFYGEYYYYLFAFMMLITAFLFIFIVKYYKEERYFHIEQ